MQKHTALYLKEFYPFAHGDYFPCEICNAPGSDVHHIKARGMGGTKRVYGRDDIMLLCRKHHEEYGDKKQYMDMLTEIHQKFTRIRDEINNSERQRLR